MISGISSGNVVTLRGSGSVKLANGLDDVITLTSLSTGKTYGQGGDDTFNLKGIVKGTVAGDAGDDTFKLYGDYLNSALKLDGGIGDDTLYVYKAVNALGTDASGVKGFEHIVFSENANKIALNNNMLAALPEFSATNADTALELNVATLTGTRTLTIGKNIDAVLTGTAVATATLKVVLR